jgi:transposase-like protein
MKRFKSQRHLQRFISIHDPIANLFHISRHDIPSNQYRGIAFCGDEPVGENRRA